MEKYRGFKVVASDKDSIVDYGVKCVGVWVGCPKPEKYLQPKPKITKTGEDTYIDGSELTNTILEVPELPEGVVMRISFLF